MRPPLIFPNILRIPEGPNETPHWRVPIDDTKYANHPLAVHAQRNRRGRAAVKRSCRMHYTPDDKGPDGEYSSDTFNSQDRMAWETQGAIFDRSQEHLGATDSGVVDAAQIARRADRGRGKRRRADGVLRDPAKNTIIEFASSYNRLEGAGAAR